MTSIEHDTDASLAGWKERYREAEQMPVGFAVWVALTNFGEHPVPSARLAEVSGRPAGEAEAPGSGHGRACG
jgi:hypothetical protein